MPAPDISAFGDGSHDLGETGLTVDGGGFGAFPGSLWIYENANRTGAADELTIGAWNDLQVTGVEIPASPNNVAGTRYLFLQREDLAWSQGFEFTLQSSAGVSGDISEAAAADATFTAVANAAAAIEAGLSAGESWAAIAAAEAGLTAGVDLDVTLAGETQAAQQAAWLAGTEAAAQFIAAVSALSSLSAGAGAGAVFSSTSAAASAMSEGASVGAAFTAASSADLSIIGAAASVRRINYLQATIN